MEEKDFIDDNLGKPLPAIIRFNNDYLDEELGQEENEKKNRSIKRRM